MGPQLGDGDMNTIITALGQRKFADAVTLQVAALPSRCGDFQANAAERKRIADRCCDSVKQYEQLARQWLFLAEHAGSRRD